MTLATIQKYTDELNNTKINISHFIFNILIVITSIRGIVTSKHQSAYDDQRVQRIERAEFPNRIISSSYHLLAAPQARMCAVEIIELPVLVYQVTLPFFRPSGIYGDVVLKETFANSNFPAERLLKESPRKMKAWARQI